MHPFQFLKRLPVAFLLSTAIFLLSTSTEIVSASSPADIGGRYSFSLTTFDPTGRLSQVSHATRASTLGPPIIAISHPKHSAILLCSPHAVPSPLVRDDGTSRFVSISPSISLCHSGIGADGRVVIDAALKCAIEHSYTYDEEVPIDILLESLSLLFQEYTMKPGCRPFGCSVLVCYLPSGKQQQYIYRIDPSGAVELMVGGATEAVCIAHIGRNSAKIAQGVKVDLQLDDDESIKNSEFYNSDNIETAKELFLQSFRQHLGWGSSNGPQCDGSDDDDDSDTSLSKMNNVNDDGDKEEDFDISIESSKASPPPILVATMTRKNGLGVKCNPSFLTSSSLPQK